MVKERNWKKPFLEILAECGNVSEACRAADISRVTVYELKKTDRLFAEEWENSIQESADTLEREAWRRAYEGVEEPVFYQGKQVALVRKKSDLLIIFLLKAIRPEKFREKLMLSPSEIDKIIEAELKAAKGEDPEATAESQALN